MTEWTYANQQLALAEGWIIADNTDHGTRIERHDDGCVFVDDNDAIEWVRRQAARGSALHNLAIDIHDQHATI